MKSSSPQFPLSEVFQVEFTNSKKMKVDEQILMSRFLSNPSTLIHHSTQLSARSFVLFLTSFTESFYRVVEKQEMDGGQTMGVLMNHAKID